MEQGLLHLHNILRWVILILLLASIIKSFSAWKGNKAFTTGDKKLWLFTMIAAHITLLIGLYQLFLGRFGLFVADAPADGVMGDKFFRFYWIEHPTAMLLATILITVGRGMSKKAVPDSVKFRKAFWFFFIALILILAGVPWPFREIIGRPLIPGM